MRLFEVGPQISPWRDRLFKCREQKYDFAIKVAVKAVNCGDLYVPSTKNIKKVLA